MSDIAIKVENLSKVYYSYSKPRYRLQEMLRPVLGKLHPRFNRNYADEFWALKDISFEVKKGESLGIIGRNGAGKSTLLQIIAGTLQPTHGTVEVNGRVNALLELGSGFNPEYTGRENVYMNGYILGFSKEYIDSKFQEIRDFSEIGDFIEQPVKTYSSGMFVRLAFAVQAMLEPEILIVDEALSVGDIFFQQKCHARISELLEKGNTTFLFVSHDTSSVIRYCKEGLYLKNGHQFYYGSAKEASKLYHHAGREYQIEVKPTEMDEAELKDFSTEDWQLDNIFQSLTKKGLWTEPAAGSSIGGIPSIIHCNNVSICDINLKKNNQFEMKEIALFAFDLTVKIDIECPVFGIVIKNNKNEGIIVKSSYMFEEATAPGILKADTNVQIAFKVNLDIINGEYTFGVFAASVNQEVFRNRNRLTHSEFMVNRKYLWDIIAGVFTVGIRSSGLPMPFWGMVDVPVSMKIHYSSGDAV